MTGKISNYSLKSASGSKKVVVTCPTILLFNLLDSRFLTFMYVYLPKIIFQATMTLKDDTKCSSN
jgi:hypothetical protein